MFYIYILYSPLYDRYYVGYTSDIDRRLEEHNHPIETNKYSSKYLPWELILYFLVSGNRGEAIKVERFIKKQKSRSFLEKLIREKNNQQYLNSLIINILKRK